MTLHRTVMAGGILIGLMPIVASAQDAFQIWECTALGENVGKTDPNYTSEIMRWPDDRFRTIEPEANYYTSDNPEDIDVSWLEVFATAGGHGNTLIGFLKKENFECKRYQD